LDNFINSSLPDIICLNETLLLDETGWEKYTSGIRNYDNNFHILKNSNLPNGSDNKKIIPFRGISVFTNDNSETSLLQKDNNHEIIVLKFYSHKKIAYKLVLGYLSPSITNKQMIETFFTKIISHINSTPLNERILIMGDFNAKHNLLFPTNSQNYAGEILGKLLHNQPIGTNKLTANRTLKNCVKHATRTNDKTKTENLLDFVITDDKQKDISIEHIGRLSDHDSILIEIDQTSSKNQNIPRLKTRCFDYADADVDGLGNELLNINNKFSDFIEPKHPSPKVKKQRKNYRNKCNQLDLGVKFLEKLLLEAFIKYVPNKIISYPADQEFSTLFPPRLQKLFRQKRLLYDKIRKSGKNPNSNSEFQNLEQQCKQASKDFTTKWLEELETTKFGIEKTFYAKIDALLDRKTNKGLIRIEKNGVLLGFKDSADQFAKSFELKLRKNMKNEDNKKI